MRKALAILLAGLGASACSEPMAHIEGSIITGVQLDGVFFHPTREFDPAAEPLAAEHATVVRYIDCSRGRWVSANVHIEDYCPLEDGDSNFLPAGTVIYSIEAALPSERLAVLEQNLVGERWIMLEPVRTCSQRGTTPGNLSAPNCD